MLPMTRPKRNKVKHQPAQPVLGESDKKNKCQLSALAWLGLSVIISIVSVLVTATWVILKEGPIVLENAQKLPAMFKDVKNQYLSWHHNDIGWSGLWGDSEGHVNAEDMNLSDTDLEILMHPQNGEINGVIASKKICELIPFNDYLFISGKINGDTALITAFTYIGGRLEIFANLKLDKDKESVILTVTPTDDPAGLFPESVRIAIAPKIGHLTDETEISKETKFDESYKYLTGFCQAENEARLQALRGPKDTSKKRYPISSFSSG